MIFPPSTCTYDPILHAAGEDKMISQFYDLKRNYISPSQSLKVENLRQKKQKEKQDKCLELLR